MKTLYQIENNNGHTDAEREGRENDRDREIGRGAREKVEKCWKKKKMQLTKCAQMLWFVFG